MTTPATSGSPTVPVRRSARLIVLNRHDRVLLFQFEDATVRDPADPRGLAQPARFWCTPGGGLEPGETFEQAAHRELWEETGFRVATLGAPVFDEEKLLLIDELPQLHHNRYFLVRVPSNEISLNEFTPLEVSVYRAHHWWSIEELEDTSEDIFPSQLSVLVSAALQESSPAVDSPCHVAN